MSARKVGVEEELLLVDPKTGQLSGVSHRAVQASENQANDDPAEVEQELFLQQIETSTEPCLSAEDLLTGIRAGRRAVGEAAAAAGARAVAMPTPVLPEDAGRFTPHERYQAIHQKYGELARGGLVCAMHVHVEVGDGEEGVRVVDGIRPWLPLLLAISANSPYWHGRDTAHASWRSQMWSRWPTAGAAQPFGDLATYRAVSREMIGWGAAMDPGMLYFDVRLSERYPTVEIRVADVCTDVEDATLVALLARALVDTSAQSGDGAPWRADLLRVAGWRAARFGVAADLVHPVKAVLVPVRDAFEAMVQHVLPSLEESGDLETVTRSFERLMATSGGAARQRRTFEASGSDLRSVVQDLADRTEASWR